MARELTIKYLASPVASGGTIALGTLPLPHVNFTVVAENTGDADLTMVGVGVGGGLTFVSGDQTAVISAAGTENYVFVPNKVANANYTAALNFRSDDPTDDNYTVLVTYTVAESVPAPTGLTFGSPWPAGSNAYGEGPFCTKADVDAIWSTVGVDWRADDDEDGAIEGSEITYIDRAIETAANEIITMLSPRYLVADFGTLAAGNVVEFIRDCNAWLAACFLSKRRGNPVPPSLQSECDRFREMLKVFAGYGSQELGLPGLPLPGVPQLYDTSPLVTNYAYDKRRRHGKIRRVETTSSTRAIFPGEKRRTATRWWQNWWGS